MKKLSGSYYKISFSAFNDFKKLFTFTVCSFVAHCAVALERESKRFTVTFVLAWVGNTQVFFWNIHMWKNIHSYENYFRFVLSLQSCFHVGPQFLQNILFTLYFSFKILNSPFFNKILFWFYWMYFNVWTGYSHFSSSDRYECLPLTLFIKVFRWREINMWLYWSR